MPYVYSTLTNQQNFHDHHPPVNNIRSIKHTVVIKGGANIPNKQIVTHLGVATRVSDEDLEFLKKNATFKDFVKNGYITYDEAKRNPEKVAADMAGRDKSAPLTENDFDPNDKVQPVKEKIETKPGAGKFKIKASGKKGK